MIDDCNLNNLAKSQVSDVFHSRAIRRSVSPKLIELCMETPCLCPSVGHKHGGRDVSKLLSLSSAIEIKIFTLELWHIEINASSSASTVELAKPKALSHLLTHATACSFRHFMSRNKILGNLNVLYNKKNPVELKHCQTSSFYRIFYLMELKPQKER